jgi:hypothetical protein
VPVEFLAANSAGSAIRLTPQGGDEHLYCLDDR